MTKPTIALAMITKNEELHLDACLQTVHNWVDEIIFSYGVLGLAIFLFSVSWVVYQSYQCVLNNIISKELFLFLITFLTFFLINSMFMSLLFFKETLFLWNLVLAGFTGFIIKHKYLRKI